MSKLNLNTTLDYSPNFDKKKRITKQIKYIIFHYTGMREENAAIKKLKNFKSKVSCHYFIKSDGKILNLVPDLYIAWHAGISSWRNKNYLNKNSIGIEISNPGHNFKYKKFSKKQIDSILKLSKYLINKYKIKKNSILGHSDISPDRKKDPGEKFPWKKLAKSHLAKWHNLNKKEITKKRLKKLSENEEQKFLKNLYNIGYRKIEKLNPLMNKRFLIKAFQRRFRQSLINGKSDQECFIISKNLLKS